MKINKTLKTVLMSAFIIGTFTSCVKEDEWSTPEILCNNRFDEPTISMADFAAKAPTTGTYKVPATGDAVIFDAYVVSSDESGNFYKTISFQDKPENPTVGLQIEVDKSSNYTDFPVGSHIRIKANGLVLGWDRGTRKIGSVDPTYAIGRIPGIILTRYLAGVCNGNNRLDVANLVPTKLTSLNDAKVEKYLNTLVTIDNVQFSKSEVEPTVKTFINYIAGVGQDTDRNLDDKVGGTAVIRNSGFSTFGAQPLPTKSGQITFVVSRYNTTWQMLIRGLNDINFTKDRFATGILGGTNITYTGSFSENFESYAVDASLFPKYLNYAVLGNRYWQVKTFSNNKYIQMSANAGSGGYQNLFMVPIDFTAANTLAFRVNVGFYNGDALKVYTTTNYTPGSDISTATLTDITSSFTIPKTPTSGYGVLTPAGTYNIPATVTGNGFIVFKYEGANPGVTTTIQIDDIVVN